MTLAPTPKRWLSPEEARTFNGYSAANAVLVKTALADRGCTCEPYADVFTFRRWLAQGRAVIRGEHGIRLTVYVAGQDSATRGTADDDREPAERTARSWPRTSFVFCRCQTEPVTPRRHR